MAISPASCYINRLNLAPFSFVDTVSELKRNESLTAFFKLKGSEEFLKDHFAGFPVMPGVLLLEALRQAAAVLWTDSFEAKPGSFFRLAEVEEAKFGKFVRPGDQLKLFVRVLPAKKEKNAVFEGRIDLVHDQAPVGKAFSAKFSLEQVH